MPFTPKRRELIALIACAALTPVVMAAEPAASSAAGVRITDAWVRAPAPGQNTAGAYVELTSDRDAAIVAAGSTAAARVEMHSTTTEDGVMRMRALSRIELPAGKSVKLAPSGTHLMLVDLKQPLRPGQKVALTLSVQASGAAAGMSLTTLTLEAAVRAAGDPHHRH